MITIPTAVLISEACAAADMLLTNTTFFMNNTLINNLQECFQGDGDYFKSANLTSELQNFIGLTAPIQNIQYYLHPFNDSLILPTINTIVNNISSFKSPSISLKNSGDDDPIISLNNMNSWTNYLAKTSLQSSKGSCSISLDEWEFTSLKCNATTIYQSTDPFDKMFGQSICLDFGTAYTANFNTARYNDTNFGSCSNYHNISVNDIIINYYNALQNYVISTKMIFDGLSNEYGNLTLQNTNYNDKLRVITGQINALNISAAIILDSIKNPINGLHQNMNCSFLKEATRDFYSNLCLDFISSIFQISIIMIVMSIFGLISMLLTFYLSRKFTAQKKVYYQKIIEMSSSPKLKSQKSILVRDENYKADRY